MSSTNNFNLKEVLQKYFGFDTFKGEQMQVIENVLQGKDSFVLMPTGGGKSLTYQLPSILLEGTAIVVSPLIALMKNQVDLMRGFTEDEGIAHFMNSSLTKTQITQVKSDVLAGKTKILYVAPETLTKEENVEFLKSFKISFYAIDEAHCISEWGHDFRPEYRKIRPVIEEIGRGPIIALTATATPKVQHDIQKNLGILDATVYKASFFRSNLYYEVKPKINPAKQIISFIKENSGKSGIIYCLSRKKVEEIAETLQVNDIKALPYHAGMDSATRSKHQDMFLMEDVDVIVATIAFGMGIDKPDVRFVPKKKFEGDKDIVQVLEAVEIVKERYKGEHVADILAGKETASIKSFKHDELEIFGLDKDKDEKFWNSVIRQALVNRLLDKDIENYGLLKLNKKGLDYMKNPYSIMITEDHNYDIVEEESYTKSAGSGASDEELFQMLKNLRKDIAKKKKVPPFVVFQDPSLEDMATRYPIKMSELVNISGVGTGKANKFGKEFIELIARYVDEKEIYRPQDLVVKSVVNKSGAKVTIIKSIDRKVNLDDIAKSQGLEMTDLITEIEAIINSGTNLDISYYINQIVDEEAYDEVYAYFLEAESESLQDAMDELGEEYYTEEEIRLVRIKFMSEVAN